MSKSYGNTIPLFEPEKALRKLIMRIKTNSLPPEAPKDPDTCTLFPDHQSLCHGGGSGGDTHPLRARDRLGRNESSSCSNI